MIDPSPSRYPGLYSPLLPDSTCVFELESGDFSGPVAGRLVPQAIDGEPYEAVSYMWGDMRKRYDITIDGVTPSITVNLYSVLMAFRH